MPLVLLTWEGNKRNRSSTHSFVRKKEKKNGNSWMGSEMLMQMMGCCSTCLRPGVKTNCAVTQSDVFYERLRVNQVVWWEILLSENNKVVWSLCCPHSQLDCTFTKNLLLFWLFTHQSGPSALTFLLPKMWLLSHCFLGYFLLKIMNKSCYSHTIFPSVFYIARTFKCVSSTYAQYKSIWNVKIIMHISNIYLLSCLATLWKTRLHLYLII